MATKDKEPAKDAAAANMHDDAAPEEQAPAVALPDDERIPVNARAVAGAPKGATEKCPFCGATKLKAAVPGLETPEEYCPGCGRGAAVEAV